MQALAAVTRPHSGIEQGEPLMVWIEHEDGTIARGLIAVLSVDNALVWLRGAASIVAGHDVAVRIAFSRSAPTLAARARVKWVRRIDETAECELEWTHQGFERDQLSMIVASLG
jgi:hypothetical protein